MKKIYFAVIFILLSTVIIISSCGTKKIEEFTLQEIADNLTEKVEFTELFPLGGDDIFQEIGIDEDAYREVVWLIPTDSLQANRLMLFEASDGEGASLIEDKLKKYHDQQKVSSETYSPAMYAVFNKTEVVKSGNFVYLVVAEDINKAKEIISQYALK